MSRKLNVSVTVALLLSALALSACATKPEVPPVAAPAPVEVVTETPPAPVAAPEPAPAPVAASEPAPAPAAIAEQPAPKPIVHKAKKKVVKKAAPPAPVAAPAPVVEPKAPEVLPQPEPSKPVTIAPQPAKKVAEPGFLEQYWLWLLGLVIVIAGIVVWRKMTPGNKS